MGCSTRLVPPEWPKSRLYAQWRERSHVEAPLASLGTQNAAGWRLIDNQMVSASWSSTTFRTTSTVPPTMLRQSADAKMKEGERRGVGRVTPLLFEGRKLLRSGARHERRSKIIAGKAVRAVNRVRGSDALEPLKQSQRLWMIGETVERYWEGRIGRSFYNVSHFKNVLAGARREARKLIVGGDVVDERIVQSLAEFVGDGQDIDKDRWIHEYRLGHLGIKPRCEGERLHKDLVVSLVCLESGVKATDAAIVGVLVGEVNGVAGDEHRNCIDADGLSLDQRVQLRADEVDVDQSEEGSVRVDKDQGGSERNFDSDRNQGLGTSEKDVIVVG